MPRVFAAVLIIFLMQFTFSSCATTDGTRVDTNRGTVTVYDLVVEQEGVLPGSFRDGTRSLFIEYPESCYNEGIEGMVEISVNIRDTGEMIDANVERGIGGGCDEAALAAIRDSEYDPAMDMEGMPVTTRHIVLVTFSQ
jgi:TonB family protein